MSRPERTPAGRRRRERAAPAELDRRRRGGATDRDAPGRDSGAATDRNSRAYPGADGGGAGH
jgi:hypothetical protein